MKEEFQGCLLGVAIGDALGVPVKGQIGKDIKAQLTLPVPVVDAHITQVRPWKLASGELTDESNLMALTLESICTQRKVDLADMVRRLKGWYNTHPKNLTPLTEHVLSRFKQGERWEEASEGASLDSEFDPPDAGHLTRCMPLALYHALRPEKLLADTITVSRLTHWDDRGTHSAATLNYLISRLTQRDKEALDGLSPFLADKNAQVRETVKAVLTASESNLDTSGSVLGVLGIAIWTLKNASSFQDGMMTVLGLGGMTNLNAAVAGGVLGAKFGRLTMPEEWVFTVEGKVRIEVLANRLFEHAIV